MWWVFFQACEPPLTHLCQIILSNYHIFYIFKTLQIYYPARVTSKHQLVFCKDLVKRKKVHYRVTLIIFL